MSETWQHDGSNVMTGEAANDEPTAGTLLRRAREAQGLHVAALAVSLKVPVRKVEALEDDRHDLLTDAVFVRALASSVCRALKIDPQPVLQRLPQNTVPRLLPQREALNTPYRSPRDGAPPTWYDQLTRPVFLAVFALLIGALVLILLPSTQQEEKTPAIAQPAVPVSEVPQAAVPIASSATPASPEAVAASPLAAVIPAVAVLPAAPASAIAVASATTAPPAVSASGTVLFRAKGPTWVEVTDAKGNVPVRKILAAGEAAGVSGVLPLQVTVGRVDQTEVQVRGKAFDLRPLTRDNVARFEVK